MKTLLSEPKIKELSLIFSEHKGERWKQRNPDAVVLATKGAPEDGVAKPSVFDRFAQTLKGWLIPDGVEVEDNIDNDGDGAEDYEKIAWLLIGAAQDLQQGFSVSGDTARAALVVATVDTFLANLDDVRSGGEGEVAKGGKRHSKADQERIDKIGEHLDAAKQLHGELNATEAKDDAGKPDDKTGGEGEAKKGEPEATEAAPAEKGAPVEMKVALDTAALKGFADQIGAMLESLKGDVETQLAAHATSVDTKLAEHGTAIDAKLADATTKAQAEGEAVNRLKASVDAIVSAARQPTSPAGQPAFNGESFKGSPMLDARETSVEIPAGTTAHDAVLRLVSAGREA